MFDFILTILKPFSVITFGSLRITIRITYLSMSTADTYVVTTVDDVTKEDVWLSLTPSQTSFTVDIRACAEAHLFLLPFYTDPESYEVVIGAEGNTKTLVYRAEDKNEPTASEVTANILSCTEFRKFWISWENGRIDVALSSPAGRSYLSWSDGSPLQVHVLRISTGPGSDGEWMFPRGSGGFLHIAVLAHCSFTLISFLRIVVAHCFFTFFFHIVVARCCCTLFFQIFFHIWSITLYFQIILQKCSWILFITYIILAHSSFTLSFPIVLWHSSFALFFQILFRNCSS